MSVDLLGFEPPAATFGFGSQEPLIRLMSQASMRPAARSPTPSASGTMYSLCSTTNVSPEPQRFDLESFHTHLSLNGNIPSMPLGSQHFQGASAQMQGPHVMNYGVPIPVGSGKGEKPCKSGCGRPRFLGRKRCCACCRSPLGPHHAQCGSAWEYQETESSSSSTESGVDEGNVESDFREPDPDAAVENVASNCRVRDCKPAVKVVAGNRRDPNCSSDSDEPIAPAPEPHAALRPTRSKRTVPEPIVAKLCKHGCTRPMAKDERSC